MASSVRTANSERPTGSRMQIALIGCNHRTAPVELRERIAFSPEQALRAADELRGNGILEEAVVVSTCNRSELYGVTPVTSDDATDAMESFFTLFHAISPAELNGRLYRHCDTDAVRHLFRVASGLDSMLLGEAEILGQVREAYGRALDHGSTGPVLNRLFQNALEVGKRVRSETELGARPMSVAFAGVKLAERVFGKLQGHSALIIGAGAVAEQVVDHLRHRGISGLRVVNRSHEHAIELARRFGGEAVEWASLETSLESPAIVVASVGATETVLTKAMIDRAMAARDGRALFVVDLGVPRNVEAETAKAYNVYLYNVDDLGEIVEQNRKAREAEIPRAEEIISEHVLKFATWQSTVETFALMERLREHLHTERQIFVNERLAGMADVSPEDRQRISRLTEELVERLLEEPSRRFRQTRELRRRLKAIEVLRELFGLDAPPKSSKPAKEQP
jgi:glutamyl-tRNA reductase